MTARLENWAVVYQPTSDFLSLPEDQVQQLVGDVFGHPRFDDGHFVRTSAIKGTHAGRVRTASGTEYELGEPSPDYAKHFPDAKARLFASWPEFQR